MLFGTYVIVVFTIETRRRACLNFLRHLEDGLAIAAMKAVASCDKPGVAACQALNPGLLNRAERHAYAGN